VYTLIKKKNKNVYIVQGKAFGEEEEKRLLKKIDAILSSCQLTNVSSFSITLVPMRPLTTIIIIAML
jgi:hypothetical protein